MAVNKGKWVLDILEEHSTNRYFIEYDGFKSNHMAHGVVALKDMGASEKQVRQFADWLGQFNEPPDHPNHPGESPTDPAVSDQQLHDLRGKQKSFYGIRNSFEMKLKEYGSIEVMVGKEFPKLSRGLGCAAFHGLIQLGYGVSVGSEKVVCEGLAYIHHSYEPIVFDETKAESDIINFGKGDTDVLTILAEIRADVPLRKQMLDGALAYKETGKYSGGGFQNRFAGLLTYAANNILQYANRIKVPLVKSDKSEKEFMILLSDWVVDQSIAVYTLSEKPNDFFLLHGVTGAWSLRQVIPLLTPKDAMDALRTFTCKLLVTYMVMDSPALTRTINTQSDDVTDETWRAILDRMLALKLEQHEEHLLKLVQVCHDRWRADKLSRHAGIYVEATNACLDHKLAYHTYQDKLILD